MTSPPGARIRARLFDADRPDQRLEPEHAFATKPRARQLLWIDVAGEVPSDFAERAAPLLELRRRTVARLALPDEAPFVALHKDYLHVRIAADPSDHDGSSTVWLDVIAGGNVVVTHHDGDLPFLDKLDARIERDATAGTLGSAAFFTVLVD